MISCLFHFMSQRIANTFTKCHQENRAAAIVYLAAGDPDFDSSLDSCRAVLEAGIDLLELGVPFSDPLADGPTNQLAAERALASGMTPVKVFELVAKIRKFSDAPIILYTYYNLVFAIGEEKYARMAKESQVDGLLILDLPPEESEGMRNACQNNDLALIHLLAPTSGKDRIQKIAESATGFIYYVSREGTTGVRSDLPDNLGDAIELIKGFTELPVAVGFGISTPEQVKGVAKVADGVVVGSALVNIVAEHADSPETFVSKLNAKAAELFTKENLTRTS